MEKKIVVSLEKDGLWLKVNDGISIDITNAHGDFMKFLQESVTGTALDLVLDQLASGEFDYS